MLLRLCNQKLVLCNGILAKQSNTTRRLAGCVTVIHRPLHTNNGLPPKASCQQNIILPAQNSGNKRYGKERYEKFKYKKQVGALIGVLGSTTLLCAGSVLSEEQEGCPISSSEECPVSNSEGVTRETYVSKDKESGTENNVETGQTDMQPVLERTAYPCQGVNNIELCNMTQHHHETPTLSLRRQESIRLARKLLFQRVQEFGCPGVVIAVTVDGKTVWTEGLGWSDLENNLRCVPDTVMRVASISKSLTMTTAAKLWEDGKLDLDAPIQKYIPTFPKKFYDGKEVTITTRHLLCHKSGIRHYSLRNTDKKKKKGNNSKSTKEDENKEIAKNTEDTKEEKSDIISEGETKHSKQSKSKGNLDGKFSSQETPKEEESDKEDEDKAKTDSKKMAEQRRKEIDRFINSLANKNRKKKLKKKEDDDEFDMEEYYIKEEFENVTEALELFQNDELFFKPGEDYKYTTHGWTLVSAVVEAAAKQPFTLIIRKLFRELGLDNTFLDQNDPIIYNRARYYVRDKHGKLKNAPYVDNSYKWAGGGFVSTVGDLCKFGNIMLYASQHTGTCGLPGYLKASTIRELWKRVEGTDKHWMIDGGYGLGWEVCEGGAKRGYCRNPHNYAAHTGTAVGASSILYILPNPSRKDLQSNMKMSGEETDERAETPRKDEQTQSDGKSEKRMESLKKEGQSLNDNKKDKIKKALRKEEHAVDDDCEIQTEEVKENIEIGFIKEVATGIEEEKVTVIERKEKNVQERKSGSKKRDANEVANNEKKKHNENEATGKEDFEAQTRENTGKEKRDADIGNEKTEKTLTDSVEDESKRNEDEENYAEGEKDRLHKDETKDTNKIMGVHQLPEGVVVAIITNMQGVGLRRTATEIAQIFQEAHLGRRRLGQYMVDI